MSLKFIPLKSIIVFQIKIDEIKLIDDDILLLKEKVRANMSYVEEELIKKIGFSTENQMKVLTDTLASLRINRLQLLQKENQTTIQLKIIQKGDELLSFNPKKKVKKLHSALPKVWKIALMLESLTQSFDDPVEKKKYEVKILEDLILSREDEIIDLIDEVNIFFLILLPIIQK